MKLNFHPARNGYHFRNDFVNHPLPAIPGFTTAGLCGGMSMSALDYWRSGMPIPTHTADDFAPAGSLPSDRVPPEGSRLRNNILRRQLDSLMVHSTYMRWLEVRPITSDVFHSWAVGKEFDDARAQIDRGTPVLLGLWSMIPGNVFGHQVLCYGYDYDPIRLYVYDSNHPDDECELVPVSPDAACQIQIGGSRAEQYRGYFVTDVYNWSEPAIVPPYHDLEIASGLTLSPNGQDVPVSGPLECSVTIQNRGDYVAHFQSLYIWVRGLIGENLDPLLGGAEPNRSSLQPGEQHLITRRSEAFGAQTGDYVVGASYLSAQGQWIGIPPGTSGTFTEQRVTLRPTTQLITDTTTTTRESDFEVDTGVVLQPGDEYALEAYGEIWGGVWGWTQNSPVGFTDRVEMNQQAPLYGVPQAHPFALLGRFENSGYFYVGQGIARQLFSQPISQRLFLRINDASPGNGTGAFQCRIRVWRLPTVVGTVNLRLRTNNGHYICAEGGGGGAVVADRSGAGGWETFQLVDQNGPSLSSGDPGALRASNGQLVCAEGGGGGAVVANRNAIGGWETFTILRADGSSGEIGNGQQVALRARNGQFVCAIGGGGGEVVADRNAIGGWETFTIEIV